MYKKMSFIIGNANFLCLFAVGPLLLSCYMGIPFSSDPVHEHTILRCMLASMMSPFHPQAFDLPFRLKALRLKYTQGSGTCPQGAPTLETSHFTSTGPSEPVRTQDMLYAESRNVTRCSEDRDTDGLAWWEGEQSKYFLREYGEGSFGARESACRGYRTSWKMRLLLHWVVGSLPQKRVLPLQLSTTHRPAYWSRRNSGQMWWQERWPWHQRTSVHTGGPGRASQMHGTCEMGPAFMDPWCASVKEWLWDSIVNWRASYKYPIRNCLHYVHI